MCRNPSSNPRPRAEEIEQGGAIERRARREAQLHGALGRGAAPASGAAAQLAGRARVDRLDRVVELADAAEAGRQRDLRETEIGRLDQRPGRLGPLGAGELGGAGAHLGGEDAVQLALAEPEPRRKAGHALAVDHAVGD